MEQNGRPKRAHITKAVRKAALERFEQAGRICALCECVVGQTQEIHLDHIIPVSKGGTSDLTNLRYVHTSCNASKGKHSDEEYGDIVAYREMSELAAEFNGLPDDRPDEFTEEWHSGLEGHNMALHRRSYGFPYGAMFHMTCSCGWSSERHSLQVDAGAEALIHENAMSQQKDPRPLRFRDHILRVTIHCAPGLYNMKDVHQFGNRPDLRRDNVLDHFHHDLHCGTPTVAP